MTTSIKNFWTLIVFIFSGGARKAQAEIEQLRREGTQQRDTIINLLKEKKVFQELEIDIKSRQEQYKSALAVYETLTEDAKLAAVRQYEFDSSVQSRYEIQILAKEAVNDQLSDQIRRLQAEKMALDSGVVIMEFTPWFTAAIEPIRPGNYIAMKHIAGPPNEIFIAGWDGRRWVSKTTVVKWRGLVAPETTQLKDAA